MEEEIVTHLDDDSKKFNRLKRKSVGSWNYLLSGEWRQSPYHQGNVCFHIRWSDDKKYWSILSVGFPNRIAVCAKIDREISVEEAAGLMLRKLKDQDGDYVGFIDQFGEFDEDKFRETYRKRSEAYSK